MNWDNSGKHLGFLSVLFWAVLLSLSLAYNLDMLDSQAKEVALARARMLFNVVETTRLWNSRHQGVYVPVDAETPPNPYIKDGDRDFEVNGKLYTKVNPAYMTRQLAELVRRQDGVVFNITSLKPIRPQNAADPWETKALTQFEAGQKEILEFLDTGAAPVFRYMAALHVQEPCLPCHRSQGYKIGDVRGGISVSIPAGHVLSEILPQRRQTLVLHVLAFLILSAGTLLFQNRLRRNWLALEAAKAEQETMVSDRTAALRGVNQALIAEITERQRIGQRLERTVRELERSNQELEHFAYIASHDLQEPLRMMGSYAQLIGRRYGSQLDEDGREFLGYMVDGSQRMKTMINDLLAYSRVDRGELSADMVNCNEAMDTALANLAVAIEDAQAEIVCGPLPELRGDASLLVRLFQNLVGNAVKYRDPGRKPQIRIRAEAGEGEWHFTIADNGIGIAAEAYDRIFMIFQRLHSRADYPGTGIGLAICRKIVDRHGGRIWVESTPGEGSIFHVTLPNRPAAEADAETGKGAARV